MKRAYVFPGQGSQFPGMGKDIFNTYEQARKVFETANEVLGFDIQDIMFNGSEDDLKQTRVTQPAVFLHSVALATSMENFQPNMVAGHSLGEFSALVANGTLNLQEGLLLVSKRANAMQKACEQNPSTMAAIIGLDDEVVENACSEVAGVVVAANYNCPGQLVISGSNEAVDLACEKLTALGARRALKLPVGGAFHSPLMESARVELESAIKGTTFHNPVCPVYQNVNAEAVSDPELIKQNLVAQLTSPVRWTQTMKNMIRDGATSFTEVGPGNVLQGLVKKIDRQIEAKSAAV